MAGVTSGGLPDLDVARVRRWCAHRIPEHLRGLLSVECDLADDHLVIYECSKGTEWICTPIALMRYAAKTGLWSLYARDRYLNFHRYQFASPSSQIQDLLDHIDNCCDPTFWG